MISFYRKPSGLIMLVVHNRQFLSGRCYYSTGEHIEASKWNSKLGLPKVGRKDSSVDALDSLLSDIKSYTLSFMRENRETLSRTSLKEFLDSKVRPKEKEVQVKKTMIEEWDDFLISVKGNVSTRTHWNYTNSKETFQEFLKKRRQHNLIPEEFNFRMYQSYQVHLKKICSPNTVAKRTKHLKMFINYLEKMRVKVDMNPDDIKFKEVSGLKIALNDDELNQMEALTLSGSIDRARDLFLLQCSTGLRVSDLFRVDRNIRDGKIVMETRKVVGTIVEIPMTDRITRILEKYNHNLPSMAEQTYREFIKEIYRKINDKGTIQVRVGDKFENRYIWQEISSHDAVRTFVTLSVERGMTIPEVASIVGKSISVLLKNYLVSNKKAAQESMLKAWG